MLYAVKTTPAACLSFRYTLENSFSLQLKPHSYQVELQKYALFKKLKHKSCVHFLNQFTDFHELFVCHLKCR